MTLANPNQSIAHKLRITDADIRERKSLLGMTAADEITLTRARPLIEPCVDQVVTEFYDFQLAVPTVRAVLGDSDTVTALKSSMRSYVLELVGGDYGMRYAEKRLRVGRTHARIGVPPKYYIASMWHLFDLISETAQTAGDDFSASLRRLMLFDMGLTFDTFLMGISAQVEAARDDLQRYSTELERIVEERTEQLAILSRIDELTGLGNRRAFGDALERECAAARRRGGSVCLMFADLDNFKSVNDLDGHDVGDEMLRRVGHVLGRTCRASDSAFRFGGDEFCLLLPETDAAGAEVLASRLAEAVAKVTDNRIGLTMGWSVSGPAIHVEPAQFLKQADKSMYRNKGVRSSQGQTATLIQMRPWRNGQEIPKPN